MSESNMKIPPEFRDATPDERIDFVQTLWDEIARNPESVPVTEEHKATLEKRLQAYDEDQDRGEPWSVVRDRILANLRAR